MRSRPLLFRGGTLVGSQSVSRGDVRIREGIITEVGPDLPTNDEATIDCGGLLVLPGTIDAHSHMWEPGLASRPDFRDDTASAVIGGITTIIDHPLTTPVVTSIERLRAKVAIGERTSFADFALHGGASPSNGDAMAELWVAGVTSFKLFTCDSGSALGGFPTDGELRVVLRRIAGLGAIAAVHAEDQTILDANRVELEREGITDVASFGRWRSPDAELTAVRRVLALAEELGAFVYFVHTSLPEAIDEIATSRLRGTRALAETCPHYLFLSDDDIVRMGHRATTSPPVRDAQRRSTLRSQVKSKIDVIGSDHGAVLAANKATRNLFAGQPGLPGNATMLPLLLTLASDGTLSLEDIVALVAENPARIFGLPSKGGIEPGRDADLTLVDPSERWTITADTQPPVPGWTPYEGMTMTGRPVRTVIRGTTIAQDGKVVAEPGVGRFTPRQHPPQLPIRHAHDHHPPSPSELH